jgi:signal transduction histidine kinase
MAKRFGPALAGRTCLTTYLDRPQVCPECPWRVGTRASRQLTVHAPATTSPLAARDGAPRLLELGSDITEQEAMRARLLHSGRLATAGDMASRVAHEIRHPLGIMSVHTDLARRDPAGGTRLAEAARHLDIVKDEIRRVARLVESSLRFGRLPALVPGRGRPRGVAR